MRQGRIISAGSDSRELFPGSLLASQTPDIELHLMHMLLSDHSSRHEDGSMMLLPFGQRLLRKNFVTHFCQSLRQFGYDRSGIALLIHPAALSQRNEEAIASIDALREAGVKLVLDRFEANNSLTRQTLASGIEYARLSKSLTENIGERTSQLLTEAAICVAKEAGVTLHAIAPDEAAGERLRAAGVDWIGIV